ncbi:MAG TPA: MliC family protein [Gammaproteobacteria bacterium]
MPPFCCKAIIAAGLPLLALNYMPGIVLAQGPSYACDKVETGSIEAMICQDGELSTFDLRLAEVYAAASEKAANEHPPWLKAEQRGWIKGRDDCWKSDDRRGCVKDAYKLRIAELQARYRLLPGTGPVTYVCDGDPRNEVVATFFRTDPATLIAERGDSVSLMYQQPSASGARYRGRNETFWEHQGEATITWGYGAPEMRCKAVSENRSR